MILRRAPGVFGGRLAAVLTVALAIGGPGNGDARAEEPKPPVVLDLVRATAERLDGGGVLFWCEATLRNASGAELQVRTNFSSVFDGVDLLVLGNSGETLHRQPYVFHQSPYSFHGRNLPLKAGETRETLRFPVLDLPGDLRSARILLAGVLPGSERSGRLRSGSVTVAIPIRTDRLLLPAPEDVRSMRAACPDRTSGKLVEFDVPREHRGTILEALKPTRREESPATWEEFGNLEVVERDGRRLHLTLYAVGKGLSAFSAGRDPRERVYYRGGSQDRLVEALSRARGVPAGGKGQSRSKSSHPGPADAPRIRGS